MSDDIIAFARVGFDRLDPRLERIDTRLDELTRIRTLYQSQNVTVAAMQIAEKKVWAHRS